MNSALKARMNQAKKNTKIGKRLKAKTKHIVKHKIIKT